MEENDSAKESEKTTLTPETKEQPSNNDTLMPTMIDSETEKVTKKRDLSAIIPKMEDFSDNNNALELISKDNALKSDGAVSIGTMNIDGEVTVNDNVKLPDQIDIEQRKIEKQRNKNSRKKKEKKKVTKSAQKVQNTTSLIVLVLIIIVGGLVYYIFNAPTDKDFKPKTVTVELGSELPLRTSSYVEPGKGKVDELLYALDLSEVDVSKVGTYNFTVTYHGISKKGQVIIKDTTAPQLEVREVIISEGSTYDASMFVQRCNDSSGCNYAFQDETTALNNTAPGSYVVYIVATDAFQNSTTKRASLIIEATGNIRSYSKEVPYNNSLGYELKENYSLRFMQSQDNLILISGTHTIEYIYQSQEKYEKDRQTYAGEANYSFDDAAKTIKLTETNLTFVGSNYSRLSDVESYLNREGFIAN